MKKGAGRVVIVTDEGVGARYAGIVRVNLEAAGFIPSIVNIPAGGGQDSCAAARLCDAFAARGLSRGDTVAALGGTCVCDAAGFAAANLSGRRGLRRAANDARRAGGHGSRRYFACGAFGRSVPCGDVPTAASGPLRHGLLSSLPEDVRAEGIAEIIRTALVADAVLFKRLEKGMTPESMAERCCKHRIALVERDASACGAQKVFRFGCAIGDALEKTTGCPSGAALAAGMAAALRMTERLELLQEPAFRRVWRRCSHVFHCPRAFPATLKHSVTRSSGPGARGGEMEWCSWPMAGCAQLCRMPAEPSQRCCGKFLSVSKRNKK